jgi:hypothetical protein
MGGNCALHRHGVMWCTYLLMEYFVSAKKSGKSTTRSRSIRVSVTFPRDQYELLDRIAREKKVSVAWVARDAVDRYLSEQWPLLAER